MLSQNQSKHIRSLHLKKFREAEQLFLVEGDKMVSELLSGNGGTVTQLYAEQGWLDRNKSLLSMLKIPVFEVTASELEKISTMVTPNQVLAVVQMPQFSPNLTLPGRRTCFYLDGIQDPGNLGTILRIADWFGIPAVYCSEDSADFYNPKVVQSSMGAIVRVPGWRISLEELVQQNPGLPILGAVMEGENALENRLLPSVGILVIGNEGKGIRPHNESLLTHRIYIPRHPNGGAESLNAAVAAGILSAFIPF
ncbi:MAG: RNA methyltransferase [Saprospiraceae bacterium]|nr:RNA methyltransferase [Saprospiraceae bacterium]